ncbi:uncharacterized protein FOMMEDRAFT_166438 [Fomitiporia mediterranea MF3/22]|uniref:uncharacterized protein n=1 Tax=Fomitiporia mediterranea (strain MF3/22) TaxID=694068 RepID=UPI0004407971|nr:uncharacterized protein FOMMEDRAFT_166438 [Fomitiporia mediterranea MF3/22]EJD06182.1 hypothetical protein FOMMEDRAFT_166438 [Fomitiporia mediterranea MF3/22]
MPFPEKWDPGSLRRQMERAFRKRDETVVIRAISRSDRPASCHQVCLDKPISPFIDGVLSLTAMSLFYKCIASHSFEFLRLSRGHQDCCDIPISAFICSLVIDRYVLILNEGYPPVLLNCNSPAEEECFLFVRGDSRYNE